MSTLFLVALVPNVPEPRRIKLDRSVMRMGRTATLEIALNPKETSISRIHCELRPSPSHTTVMVRDLQSTNGTSINGVKFSGEGVLAIGELLQVGPYIWRLETEDDVMAEEVGTSMTIEGPIGDSFSLPQT